MRKLVLMALAGAALILVAPQTGSASPLVPASGLNTAADNVLITQDVRHRRWHRHWRHRWHHRHWRRHHCWHRRHWSGRRCW